MTRTAAQGCVASVLFLAALLPARESATDRTASAPERDAKVIAVGDDAPVSFAALNRLGRVRLHPGRDCMERSETGRGWQPPGVR
jgi:hypothetical protein